MKLIYILFIILAIFIISGIYIYYNVNKVLTEGFETIDNYVDAIVNSENFDPLNFNYIDNIKQNMPPITDASGVIDISNINVNEIASKLSVLTIDQSTVDKRRLDDDTRRCELYKLDVVNKINQREHYMNTGNFSTVRANDLIINNTIKAMSDLGC